MRIHIVSSATTLALAALLAALSVAACGGGEAEPLPACPEGGTDLTYESFGRAFFETHCTDCHSSSSGVAEAQDKPFDSQANIQASAEEIYAEAAGTNERMPPNGGPTAEERQQLAEWLSCGAK